MWPMTIQYFLSLYTSLDFKKTLQFTTILAKWLKHAPADE